ncbi:MULTISPECIES: PLP-dependent aminotransferase family protein [Pediococcus]|jgi:2-aminoadipate transaminase|uniref:Aminotransferase class I/II-fold pyridoxal phosphate-dependent enzyme n=1 Tax=Pediococcus parvulus TaxID=54062 RepID=A0A176TLN3_9LACO|nr:MULTISPECIES: PLP-dependent aminotransferase family protein [Pediococcus]MCT3026893.1 PLP-dependent aminotransferase family protein [Pediococcus parvulus]MCT3028162.1 PLP-dependent aminotransferase family protein [Pediococcus parvulus]MCT3035440.1 PLP-dependent aminotransferase family protein [Pediococcus parvulus]MDV7695094.1 aminotransferase class I/II-fold pyridoxal phosphate-dependent enzyme [Pediococcus parvulus]OAD64853.1 aspartate aminotransferase [Pediococcus parvulus]
MEEEFASRVSLTSKSGLNAIYPSRDPEMISFTGGFPDASLFPNQELAESFQIAVTNQKSPLQYQVGEESAELRSKIADLLNADGTVTCANQIMMTQGAQQGLDLVAKLVINKGDGLVVEGPTYIGALAAFDAYEPNYFSVSMEDDGMNLTELKRMLIQNSIKLIYTIPDFQNPTGIVMSLEKRQQLIELANRYDVLILEDAPYRWLRYEGEPLPTLKSMDTQNRVIQLGSFSKILAPGLRLGWLSAGGQVFNRLQELKAGADLETSNIMIQTVNAYLSKYSLSNHLEKLRKSYRIKRDAMMKAMQQYMPNNVSYTKPQGGFFTWITVPENIDLESIQTKQLKPSFHVMVIPSTNLFPDKSHKNGARVSFSSVSLSQIDLGVQRLGNGLSDGYQKQSI